MRLETILIINILMTTDLITSSIPWILWILLMVSVQLEGFLWGKHHSLEEGVVSRGV